MLVKTQDIQEINSLDNQIFGYEAYSLSNLESMINYNDFYLITNQESQVVGFMIMQLVDNDFELIKIGILKQYRNNNYAFLAIDEFISNNKFNKIFLEVKQTNHTAIKLYEKIGFKIINIRKNYYSDNSNALIMSFERD